MDRSLIKRVFRLKASGPQLACVTLDLEEDYAGMTSRFETLDRPDRIGDFLNLLRSHQVPLTVFVVTRLLRSHPHAVKLLAAIQPEWACHSHHHRLDVASYKDEVRQSLDAFTDFFGFVPVGFRAPAGRLHPGDVEVLWSEGFTYDSSIFPAVWSFGAGFRHCRFPTLPWEYENGLIELPFAVLPTVRVVLSVSYVKLLGIRLFKSLLRLFPPEPVVIIDSHLHDFVPTPARKELPLHMRLAFKRNEAAGLTILGWLIDELRSRRYSFVTMSELANYVRRLA